MEVLSMGSSMNVETFADQVLPGIVTTASDGLLSALFTTRNTHGMGGFQSPSNSIEMLTFNVRSGDNFLSLDLFVEPPPITERELGGIESLVSTRASFAGVRALCQRTSLPILCDNTLGTGVGIVDLAQDDMYTLVVIFAEAEDIREIKSFARCVRDFNSRAVIVLVTCDCDLHLKKSPIGHLQDHLLINYWVTARGCGGALAMKMIADRLVRLWRA